MRFQIEKTFLKQVSERSAPTNDEEMTLIQTEAESVRDAVRHVISRSDSELVDEVHWLPGSQAVTAVREGSRVYMLQFFPLIEDSDFDEEAEAGSRRPLERLEQR